MPKPHRRSVRSRILWEYAKLIASSRLGIEMGWAQPPKGAGKGQFWAVVNSTFGKLQSGEINPSTILRENKLLVAGDNSCVYCGNSGKFHWEHIIPVSRGGPNTIDNMVLACAPCNHSKGAKDVREWCKSRGKGTPRIVLGKYLKLLLDAHAENGSLDWASYPPDEPLGLSRFSGVFKEH